MFEDHDSEKAMAFYKPAKNQCQLDVNQSLTIEVSNFRYNLLGLKVLTAV
jgi:hypothetical protein